MDRESATRIANAIMQNGSGEHGHGPGATLTVIAKFAEEGNLPAMSEAIIAHSAAYPRDRDAILKRLPLKVLNQYLYIHRQHSHVAIERWQKRTPDWETTLLAAVFDPVRFEMVASIMSEQLGRAEVGR